MVPWGRQPIGLVLETMRRLRRSQRSLRAASGRTAFVGDAIADPLTACWLRSWRGKLDTRQGGRFGLAMSASLRPASPWRAIRIRRHWTPSLTAWSAAPESPFQQSAGAVSATLPALGENTRSYLAKIAYARLGRPRSLNWLE